jgi:ribonuclease D
MYPIITDTASLEALCERLAQEPVILVDTEFMREKTYYSELCLIQIAGEKEAAAIDPLAKELDLTPLYTLLANPAVLKVFHACRQDMEIFYHAMGKVPSPIFDTQIAAMVCGYGESVSYASLVEKIMGIPVDKSSRFTDWSKRPLSPNQLEYAMNDVVYLREIYKALAAQLQKTRRTSWIEEEMQPLLDPATYDMNPDEAWQRIKLRNTSPRYLALLQAVARWREITARSRNIPRTRIMKDDTLAEVANAKPQDFTALQAIRGFYPTMQAAQYDSLFADIQKAMALPTSECPRLPDRVILSGNNEALIDMLRMLLKVCAGTAQVVPRIIADKDGLELLALGKRENIHALTGWRYDIFGKQALRMLEGKIALKADGKNSVTFLELE